MQKFAKKFKREGKLPVVVRFEGKKQRVEKRRDPLSPESLFCFWDAQNSTRGGEDGRCNGSGGSEQKIRVDESSVSVSFF